MDLMRIFTFLLLTLLSFSSLANDLEKCGAFIKSKNEGEQVHNFQPCLNLAKNGHVGAQYAIAMSYEGVKKGELAQKYYMQAANKGFAPAFLNIGHMFNEVQPWKAIYWYQRYFQTGEEGSGYAAKLISIIFQRLELNGESEYWVKQCLTTAYTGCNVVPK